MTPSRLSPNSYPPADPALLLRWFVSSDASAEKPLAVSRMRAAHRATRRDTDATPSLSTYADRVRQLVSWGALGSPDPSSDDPAFWPVADSPLVLAVQSGDLMSDVVVPRIITLVWQHSGTTRSRLNTVSSDPSAINAALEMLVDARALRIVARAPEQVGSSRRAAPPGRAAPPRVAVPADFRFVATLTGYGEHLAYQIGLPVAA